MAAKSWIRYIKTKLIKFVILSPNRLDVWKCYENVAKYENVAEK